MQRLEFSEEHDFIGWYGPNIAYPLVPVTLFGPSGSVTFLALLDSGADDCIFHADYAAQVGLQVKAGRQEKRGGIVPDETTPVYVHEVDMSIGDHQARFRCEVAFSLVMPKQPTDQLIGREGVFDKLRIGFRLSKGKVYLGSEVTSTNAF